MTYVSKVKMLFLQAGTHFYFGHLRHNIIRIHNFYILGKGFRYFRMSLIRLHSLFLPGTSFFFMSFLTYTHAIPVKTAAATHAIGSHPAAR